MHRLTPSAIRRFLTAHSSFPHAPCVVRPIHLYIRIYRVYTCASNSLFPPFHICGGLHAAQSLGTYMNNPKHIDPRLDATRTIRATTRSSIKENTRMLFGDAKSSVDALLAQLSS
jgi:hypothetical protein